MTGRAARSVRSLVTIVTLALAACTSVEDKRVRQLLNDKGFGTRATGVPTVENHVTGGDAVYFVVDPSAYLNAGAEQLYLLTTPQPLSIDGTILIPYVGPIDALGKTERELTTIVNELLAGLFTFPIQSYARILDAGKAVYVYGEVNGDNYVPFPHADMTLFELLARSRITRLANWGRIHLIRPDAENPLVMIINMRELVMTGNTTYNITLENNDIIYVPPTFLGHIARIVEKLLEPLAVAVNALFGFASLQSLVSGDYNGYYSGYRY